MAEHIGPPSASTRRLLWAGVVAGPLFLGTWVVQALVRDGFDPGRHPISLRSAAVATVASLVGALVLAAWPDPASFTIRIVLASAVQFGWIAAVAASRLRLPVRGQVGTSHSHHD